MHHILTEDRFICA